MPTSADDTFLKWEAGCNCPPAREHRARGVPAAFRELSIPPVSMHATHRLIVLERGTECHRLSAQEHLRGSTSGGEPQGESILRCIRLNTGSHVCYCHIANATVTYAYQSFNEQAKRRFRQNVLNIKTFHSKGFWEARKVCGIHNSCLPELHSVRTTIKVSTV